MKCVLAFAFFSLMIPAVAAGQERVSFPSTDADLKGGTPTTITGYLYKPAGAGPFAAVVGLHGCSGLKGPTSKLYEQWGEFLSRAGYVLLLVDYLQPRGWNSVCEDFGVGLSREIPRDAVGGMNYLRSRPDIRPDSLAIMGWSYGGMATLFTMSKGALAQDVALPKAPERDFRAAIVFYPSGCLFLLGRNPATNQTNTHWRPRQPMLLLMGETDNYTPAAPCEEVIAQATREGGPQIDAHFYANTYHVFDHPNLPITVLTDVKLPPDGHSPTVGSNPEARADAINRVTQFLSKQLQ
jgi:dienelactone hydrolase